MLFLMQSRISKRDVLKQNPKVARRLHNKLVRELKGLGSPEDFVETISGKI